jgi:hypothetical protein
MSRFQHPSYSGRLNRAASAADARPAAPEPAATHQPSPRYSQRACCCPAPPSVIAVIPANSRQAPVELLLCGHHYRQSRRALAAIGAELTDLKGRPLASEIWPEAVS